MKTYIIDGSMFLYRAYYAIPDSFNSKGEPVGALMGFGNSIAKILKPGDRALVCYDHKENFRKGIYDQYKAKRKPMNDDLFFQLQASKKLLDSLGIKHESAAGFEADDIIASYVAQNKSTDKIIIVSSDKDLYQLLNDKTVILNPFKNIIITSESFYEEFGITPIQWRDVQAIAGDPVDGVSGVPGIGIKGAMDLIINYKSLENIEKHLSEIPSKYQKKFANNMEYAHLSSQLVTLRSDVNCEYSLCDLVFEKNKTQSELVHNFCHEYELFALLDTFNKNSLVDFYEQSEGTKYLDQSECIVYSDSCDEDIYSNNSDKLIVYHSIDHSWKHSAQQIKNMQYEDLSIMYYVANGGIKMHANTSTALACVYKNMKYALYKSAQTSIYYNIERRLIPVLLYMHNVGVCVDINALRDINHQFQDYINKLSIDIYQIAGREFLINSSKQTKEVMEELGFNIKSTDSETLSKIDHDIAPLIIDWRHKKKILSDQISACIKHAIFVDGEYYIYPKYYQDAASTGRIPSRLPNIQNIPRNIRNIFRARGRERKIIAFDYNQLELRILSYISQCKALISDFNNGIDIHHATAKRIFNTDKIDDALRTKAKAMNFGIIYGMSAFGLVRRAYIDSIDSANKYLDSYFQSYPEVKDYIDQSILEWHKNKCVYNIYDRQIRNIRGDRSAINAPIQSSAADIIKIAMINIHKFIENKDIHMVLQVHDELVFDMKYDEEYIKQIKQIMESVHLSLKLQVTVKHGDDWKNCV